MNRIVEILERGREIIADESHWTKGDAAVLPDGSPARFNDPDACGFCALGALWRGSGTTNLNHPDVIAAERSLRGPLESRWENSIADMNDHDDTTHADIIALFDRAIESERTMTTEVAA